MRGDSQTFVDLVLYYLSVIMYIVYWLESIEGLREGAKPKWVWENRDRITFLKNFVCLWWNAVFWWNYAAIKSQKSWRIYGENACHLCLEKEVVFLITLIIFALKKEKLFLYDMKVTLWLRMNLNLRFTIRRNVFITQLYSACTSE